MRKHAAKAVATLVRCLDDPNPWVHLTAARTIVERVLPAADFSDPEACGPALVLPPGTRVGLLTAETRAALGAARQSAPADASPPAGPASAGGETDAPDMGEED
jgi:hypothetical protein